MSGKESVPVLLQAQAHVWRHVSQLINSMSLKCAVQLGLPDVINKHGRPMTISQLVTELRIPSSKTACLHRLMRLLVHSGFFAIETSGEEEGYALTPSSRLLLKENKRDQSPLLLLLLDPVLVTPWQLLSEWFQGDEPMTPFHMSHGVNLWDYASKSSELNNLFNEAMASDARFMMDIVVKQFGSHFEGLKSLVDVGGGTGVAACAIANAFPHVKCTVLDLPHVVTTAPKSSNVDFVGGDMFQYIPPANAVFLKWILHDWSDENCVQILRRCKEAIPSREEGGKVIIIDAVVDSQNQDHIMTETQLFLDMWLMVLLEGKERDECEWRRIITDAGFADYKIMSVIDWRSIIEVYP